MAVRLKLEGPVIRKPILLYEDDLETISAHYAVMGLSGFVRELVHRHCISLTQQDKLALHNYRRSTHDKQPSIISPDQIRDLG